MITVTVGLQESQNKGPDWDEDSCSDLVNQIGQKLEQIGRLDDSQKTDVLSRAQRGGFIRWHTLSTEQRTISLTNRDGCMNVFSVSVGLEECGSGVIPVVLEEKQLRKLVRHLGSDLVQLRRLKMSQVADVCYGLETAGFVECFGVQEAVLNNPSISPGNCNTDFTKPTPSSLFTPYLPTTDPKTLGPSNNIPPTCDKPNLWMNYMYNYGCYPGSEVDRALDASQTADESIPLATPHPVPGIASPAESISTPGLDGGASSYSTPSMYLGSPQIGERSLPGLGATMFNQAAEPERLVSDWSRQSRTIPVTTRSNPTTLQLLQSCKFGQGRVLEEERIQMILEAEVHLAVQDPCGMLQLLLGEWNSNVLLGLHALGLPARWKGIQGAVDYLRVLDADETKQFLDPVAKRIGQVLLYFNYEELCKHPEESCPPSTSKRNATRVLNCILKAYTDDPRIDMPIQSRRNKISGYHVRRGKWLWKLAGTLGVGILLIGDSSLMSIMCNNSFTNDQINALATLAFNTRPGTIHIFHTLEPMVKSLMFGWVTDDLYQAIWNDELGLFGRRELARAHDEDEAAVACQRIENPWKVVDAGYWATKKMTEFVASVPAT